MSMRPSDNLAYRIMRNYRPTSTVVKNTESNDNSFFKRKEDTPEQKIKTDVVSEKVTVSPVAATVATVPEKLPAMVPNEPLAVVQTGASLMVKAAKVLRTASPVFNSILIK